MAKRRTNRVREEAAAYVAGRAQIVVMEGNLLDKAEEYMRGLRAKAVRVSRALTEAGIPHAVIGGMAVLAHVLKVDETAEHTTRVLDLLLSREDVGRAAEALKSLGLCYRVVLGIPAFVPPREPGRPDRFRQSVHLVWAGEKVRPGDVVPAPLLNDEPTILSPDGYACLDVARLLRMKLTSFRLKDQVHIQDLLEMKLITRKIKESLPPELRARLKQVEEATERERLG